MLRRMMVLVTVLALLVLCAIPAGASTFNENRGELKLAGNKMVLDGEMDDSYPGGFHLNFNRDSNMTEYEEPVAQAWLVWEQTDGDKDYIWCYVEVEDMNFSGGGSEFYMRDSVELFLNFNNSDEKSDIYQLIADVDGNAKTWSDSSNPPRNFITNGVNGEITTVSDENGEYFSCVVNQKEFYYTVEYRVVCDKLDVGQEIAYSMQTHDFPDATWYFCEGSTPPSNWDASSYDYFVVSGDAVVPQAPVTRPPIETLPLDTELVITDAPEETPPATTGAPATESASGTEEKPEEKSGCGTAIGSAALIPLLILPALKRKRR